MLEGQKQEAEVAGAAGVDSGREWALRGRRRYQGTEVIIKQEL